MQRSRDSKLTNQPANWAEWLFELGKLLDRQIGRGAGIEEVSRRLQSSSDTCKLGVVFFRSSDVVKIRAMVEDWSRDRLVMELGGIYRSLPQKLQAGTR